MTDYKRSNDGVEGREQKKLQASNPAYEAPTRRSKRRGAWGIRRAVARREARHEICGVAGSTQFDLVRPLFIFNEIRQIREKGRKMKESRPNRRSNWVELEGHVIFDRRFVKNAGRIAQSGAEATALQTLRVVRVVLDAWIIMGELFALPSRAMLGAPDGARGKKRRQRGVGYLGSSDWRRFCGVLAYGQETRAPGAGNPPKLRTKNNKYQQIPIQFMNSKLTRRGRAEWNSFFVRRVIRCKFIW